MSKQIIREEMKLRRRMLSKSEIEEKSRKICDEVYELLKESKSICIYKSSFKEVDTEYLIDRLRFCDKKIVFPVSDMKTKTIKLFKDTGSFIKGAYGILEPEKKEKVSFSEIDTVIVPGIAFDKLKNRLGFGEGYYDRLLSEMNVLKIGICYDFQLVEEIPSMFHDVKMDIIVTEKHLIK